jgi:hypothetical protein
MMMMGVEKSRWIRDMEIMLRIVWGEDKTEEWIGAII